jgi:succinate dehydrogenase flavin-adding protein (antitoxin of CptAB toxin-antitoxin module)
MALRRLLPRALRALAGEPLLACGPRAAGAGAGARGASAPPARGGGCSCSYSADAAAAATDDAERAKVGAWWWCRAGRAGGGARDSCPRALVSAAVVAATAAAPHPRLLATSPSAAPLRSNQLVNKLLYRSKQRGFLELDLLVGLWAEEQLPRLPLPALREFAAVLDEVRGRVAGGGGGGGARAGAGAGRPARSGEREGKQEGPASALFDQPHFARRARPQENPDLFKWLTGQLPTPEHLQRNAQYMVWGVARRAGGGGGATTRLVAVLMASVTTKPGARQRGVLLRLAFGRSTPALTPSPQALKAHVDRQLADNLHHAAAAVAGKDWVRGWDDPNRAPAAGGGGGGGGQAQ